MDFQVGLLMLALQLFLEGLGNIPAVTMAVLGFNVYLYVFPAAPPLQACINLPYVWTDEEWRRLFLSPLHHVNDLHLGINMVSFLTKGVWLERRLGSNFFLYLLSVLFLLTGLVYLLLQAALTKLTQDPDPFSDFLDLLKHRDECAVGFSGVLFALRVITNHYNPGDVTYVLGIPVPNRFASWVELVLIYKFAEGTSLIGHLAGILVGLFYTVGPLKRIMTMLAVLGQTEKKETPPKTQHHSTSSGGFSLNVSLNPKDILGGIVRMFKKEAATKSNQIRSNLKPNQVKSQIKSNQIKSSQVKSNLKPNQVKSSQIKSILKSNQNNSQIK